MKVSIITPCYNSAATIGETLKSIAGQEYPSIEHIVVDGKSRDCTLEIIQQYERNIDTLISEEDRGIYHAINKGLDCATGDIVGILNSDDTYATDEVIAKVVGTFEDEKVSAVYGDLLFVDEDGEKVLRSWKAGPFNRGNFKRGWMPPHPTLFLKKELYERYGRFDLELNIAADYELVLRFLYKNEVPVSYIPEVLVKMRPGGVSNRNFGSRLKALIEDYRAWRKNDLGALSGLRAQLLKRVSKMGQFLSG